jgi:hypothetical protein
MNSKQLTQQLCDTLNVWRKSNPSATEVREVLETLASEVDMMENFGYFSVEETCTLNGHTFTRKKDISSNAVMLDKLMYLCNQLEDMTTERAPVEEYLYEMPVTVSSHDVRSFQRNQLAIFQNAGLI